MPKTEILQNKTEKKLTSKQESPMQKIVSLAKLHNLTTEENRQLLKQIELHLEDGFSEDPASIVKTNEEAKKAPEDSPLRKYFMSEGALNALLGYRKYYLEKMAKDMDAISEPVEEPLYESYEDEDSLVNEGLSMDTMQLRAALEESFFPTGEINMDSINRAATVLKYVAKEAGNVTEAIQALEAYQGSSEEKLVANSIKEAMIANKSGFDGINDPANFKAAIESFIAM